jgi:hypothetical protein
MEATCSCETSVYFQRTTQCHIPDGSGLHNHHCEILESYKTCHFIQDSYLLVSLINASFGKAFYNHLCSPISTLLVSVSSLYHLYMTFSPYPPSLCLSISFLISKIIIYSPYLFMMLSKEYHGYADCILLWFSSVQQAKFLTVF